MISLSKNGFPDRFRTSPILELEVKLPLSDSFPRRTENYNALNNEQRQQSVSKSLTSKAASLSEIFFGEGLIRFNSVLGGAAFISVSLGYQARGNSSKNIEDAEPGTFVRLWSVPNGELQLDRRHQVDSNSPCKSDELVFSSNNVSVTQSPDASLIAVTSDNMIGIYEIVVKREVPYFKWNCSYLLPADSIPLKATFHVGSAAISIKSTTGDIDWIDIKGGEIKKVEPTASDCIRIAKKPLLDNVA